MSQDQRLYPIKKSWCSQESKSRQNPVWLVVQLVLVHSLLNLKNDNMPIMCYQQVLTEHFVRPTVKTQVNPCWWKAVNRKLYTWLLFTAVFRIINW